MLSGGRASVLSREGARGKPLPPGTGQYVLGKWWISLFYSDCQIIVRIVNLKQHFHKKKQYKRIKEDQKQEYRQKLQNTILNLALSLFRDLQNCW